MALSPVITLCIDFGNTRQKAAMFHDAQLKEVRYFEEDLVASLHTMVDDWKPHRAILSSVINHPAEIESLLATKTKYHLLNAKSKLPFTTPVGKPETIGADRLALCGAATLLFPKKNKCGIGLDSGVN